jgi:hypothetical protein
MGTSKSNPIGVSGSVKSDIFVVSEKLSHLFRVIEMQPNQPIIIETFAHLTTLPTSQCSRQLSPPLNLLSEYPPTPFSFVPICHLPQQPVPPLVLSDQDLIS